MLANRKVNAFQLYLAFILAIGISNHVILLPVLLDVAKRDSWVGAAAAFVPMALWACAIGFIVRRTGGRKLTDWLHERYGPVIRVAIAGLIAAYAIVTAWIALMDTVLWTQASYLPRTPKIAIAAVFLTFCFFAAKSGLRAIAITSGLLLPAVIALGYFVAFANLKYKDYSLLLPVFTHGYAPAGAAMAYVCGGVLELILLLFVQQYTTKGIRLRGLLVLSILLVGLTVGPLTGSISLFGPFEAALQRYPAFEQWRMATLSKFVTHLDFFSIYQWVSGTFIHISLLLFLVPDVWSAKREKSRTAVLVVLCLLFAASTLLPVSDMFLLDNVEARFFPAALVLNALLTAVLLLLSLLPPARKGAAA